MAVEYNYDANANVINTHAYGKLSVSEVLGYFDDIMNNDAIADRAIEVVRFDKVDDFLFF